MLLAEAFVEIKSDKTKYLSDMKGIKRATDQTTLKMQTGWNRVGKAITDNANKIRKAGIGIAAAGAVITGAIMGAVHAATKMGDELDKMSLRTGESVESLSALSYAAQISGSSIQAMENGIRRLSRNMNDFQQGIGEAKRAFEKLGISVLDNNGNLRSASSFIIEVADKFNQLTSSSEQAAIAQEIFGRGGATMLPLLKQGSAGIRELTERAEELGLVMSTQAAAAAAEFNDRMTELTASLKMAVVQLGTKLLPVLQPTIEDMTELVGMVTKWTEANPGLTRAVGTLGLAVGSFATVVGGLAIILPTLVTGLGILLGAIGGPGIALIGAFSLLAAVVIGAKGKVSKLRKEVDELTESAKKFTQLDFAKGVPGAVSALANLDSKVVDVLTRLDELRSKKAILGVSGLEEIEALELALYDLQRAQLGLSFAQTGDPGIANQIKQLDELRASYQETTGLLGSLSGERAPHVRMPIVREQLIPEIPETENARMAAQNLVNSLSSMWQNYLAGRRAAHLTEIEAEEAAENEAIGAMNARSDAAAYATADASVEAKQDEVDRKMQLVNQLADMEAASEKKALDEQKKNKKAYEQWLNDWAITNATMRNANRIKLAEETAEAVKAKWDSVGDAIQSELQSAFQTALDGNIKSWGDFWNVLLDMTKRYMAQMAAGQIAGWIRGLLPGGNVDLNKTGQLATASVALNNAAVNLNVAAQRLSATNIGGTGSGQQIPGMDAGSGGGAGMMAQASGIPWLQMALLNFRFGQQAQLLLQDQPAWMQTLGGLPFGPAGGLGRMAAGGDFFPGFAEGGIVRKPTLAMVGEKGPEAIIPLSKGTSSGTTGGNRTYVLNIPNTSFQTMTEADIEREFRRQIPMIQKAIDRGEIVVG